MNCTRPDIAYAVNKLSRFTSNPSKNHWKGLIRVLRYLKYTSNYGLHYTRYPVVLEGYSDANWISDSKDTKSTSGYVFTIGGGAVSWKSSKQTCIARSTMESEFIALDKAGEEAEWLRNFLEDIPCWTKPVPASMIHCDSQSAIGRAQSDDMLIMGSNRDVILTTKRMLTKHFDMKDMGLADVILGIKISKTSDGLALSQSYYIENILKKFKAYDSPPAKTPVDLNLHLAKNKGEPEGQIEYSRIIGSLMYIMNCTRPDIAYAVNKLSRFTSNPSKNHWKGLIRVLRYLKYTSNYGLHYTRYPVVLEGYSDANWISDSKDTKSTSGYVFTIGGGAVSWKSSKQTCIARSTMESEFIALDKAGEEAEWLRNFLEDIPCWTKPVPAIMIHCDSQSAIGRAQSGMYNGKSRHIRRRHNTIRQLISSGIISIDYIKSKENLADPLTKGLSRDQVYCLSRGMGLKPDN
ncbi:UNVERIFIED_CONTAM: Retrovirus-related Pol polyprotein from transposon TNT 1-94 [Sesamum radiatum]|uniref:Retrovirus-related Pol polyprotein from transposon TNT 1-94 n=1 Tax=Sesamum radiatum TaxID=300843 RepID=A0AAW2UBA8_SESRA